MTTEAPKKSPSRRPWRWGVLGLVVMLLGAAAWAQRHPDESAHAAPSTERVVRTAAPRLGDARATFTLPGTARPSETVTLVARASGFIRDVRVDLGDRVAAGQTLMTIDAKEVNEELALARASGGEGFGGLRHWSFGRGAAAQTGRAARAS